MLSGWSPCYHLYSMSGENICYPTTNFVIILLLGKSPFSIIAAQLNRFKNNVWTYMNIQDDP